MMLLNRVEPWDTQEKYQKIIKYFDIWTSGYLQTYWESNLGILTLTEFDNIWTLYVVIAYLQKTIGLVIGAEV